MSGKEKKREDEVELVREAQHSTTAEERTDGTAL
jgi:hypothetical protein